MYPEDFEGAGNQPIDQRRLLQIGDAVEPGGYIITRREHVAGYLRLDGVNVVLKVRRRNYAREIYEGRAEDDDQEEIAIPSGCN